MKTWKIKREKIKGGEEWVESEKKISEDMNVSWEMFSLKLFNLFFLITS